MAAKGGLSEHRKHSYRSFRSEQDMNMISNLISHSNGPIRTMPRFQSPSTNTFKLKLQASSKSYANKLKQRQNSRVIPSSAKFSTESDLFSNQEFHSKEFLGHKNEFKISTPQRYQPLLDPTRISSQLEQLDSNESFLKHKSSVYSDASALSYNRTPKEEVLLNVVSTEKPRIELQISPIKKSPRGSRSMTPVNFMHENHLKEFEKMSQIERKLADQNDKLIKLERKYREAMAKKTRLEIFYEDMIKKLTRELGDLKDKSANESNKEVKGVINSVLTEVDDVRSKVTTIEDRIKNFVINFS